MTWDPIRLTGVFQFPGVTFRREWDAAPRVTCCLACGKVERWRGVDAFIVTEIEGGLATGRCEPSCLQGIIGTAMTSGAPGGIVSLSYSFQRRSRPWPSADSELSCATCRARLVFERPQSMDELLEWLDRFGWAWLDIGPQCAACLGPVDPPRIRKRPIKFDRLL